MSAPEPHIVPRCSCGAKTHWKWEWYTEPEDLDVDEEPHGEWWAPPCWHCTAISIMESDRAMARMGMEPDGRLKPAMIDRFVELAMDTTHMLPIITECGFASYTMPQAAHLAYLTGKPKP